MRQSLMQRPEGLMKSRVRVRSATKPPSFSQLAQGRGSPAVAGRPSCSVPQENRNGGRPPGTARGTPEPAAKTLQGPSAGGKQPSQAPAPCQEIRLPACLARPCQTSAIRSKERAQLGGKRARRTGQAGSRASAGFGALSPSPVLTLLHGGTDSTPRAPLLPLPPAPGKAPGLTASCHGPGEGGKGEFRQAELGEEETAPVGCSRAEPLCCSPAPCSGQPCPAPPSTRTGNSAPAAPVPRSGAEKPAGCSQAQQEGRKSPGQVRSRGHPGVAGSRRAPELTGHRNGSRCQPQQGSCEAHAWGTAEARGTFSRGPQERFPEAPPLPWGPSSACTAAHT